MNWDQSCTKGKRKHFLLKHWKVKLYRSLNYRQLLETSIYSLKFQYHLFLFFGWRWSVYPGDLSDVDCKSFFHLLRSWFEYLNPCRLLFKIIFVNQVSFIDKMIKEISRTIWLIKQINKIQGDWKIDALQ